MSITVYLLIGPLFALPRTGSVSYELAVRSYVPQEYEWLASLLVTAVFFALTYYCLLYTSEFDSYVPYFYSTYEEENESIAGDRKKILVLGSGPIRIGQGVEFDYSTVHAVKTIRDAGYEAIVINNNPETVSTDYTTSDKLYFEPLCVEDVMNVIELEQPEGVIASLGGQTAINLAEPLEARGVTIIGTDCKAIEKAENRESFEKLLAKLSIPQPKGQAVTNIEDLSLIHI